MPTDMSTQKPTISGQLDQYLDREEDLLSMSLMKTMQALKDDPTNPAHIRTITQTKKALAELKKKALTEHLTALLIPLNILMVKDGRFLSANFTKIEY